ncbi:MAG: hypothetical protein JW783_03900 [Bacteroidales bacterium]|nr:hypothetical protein [Bacteroidales bacterium]MBN2748139.1 hypothetical protein [Bacteroidales bacterium]
MNRFISLIAFIVLSQPLYSQKVDSVAITPSINQRNLQVVMQHWINTDNAAGLAFANVNKGGFTTFEKYFSGGNHHRAQEGDGLNGIRFYSEGYRSFNKRLFARGSFHFNKFIEQNRAWSDVVNTNNSNPYIMGSSVKGDYDSQQIGLTLKVYTDTIGRFTYGLSSNYEVLDVSRQRDPRTRTYLLDYNIVPSVTYKVSANSKLGANLYYRFQKEKMPSITTVQTDPNLKYYTFWGLQNFTSNVGGYKGFRRQFESDFIGSAVQYNYTNDAVNVLVSGGVDLQWQETAGEKKQSPGSFNSFGYNLLTSVLIKSNRFVHNAVLAAKYSNGAADEYRQSLFTILDPATGTSSEYWVTDYIYKNRFVTETYNLDLSWKTYGLKQNGHETKWSLGIDASYSSFSNTYYLPTSTYSASVACAGISGSYLLLDRRSHSIEISSYAKGGINLDAELDLANTSEVSDLILTPDLEYYKRSTAQVGGAITYNFPLVFAGRGAMTGYARIYGENMFASNSYNWHVFGLAIGLLTL